MLIRKSLVRKVILNEAKRLRPGWDCKQVSPEVYTKLDYIVRVAIRKGLKHHPTRGKTFKEFSITNIIKG